MGRHMKTVQNPLTIVLLAISIIISGVSSDFVGAQDTEADPVVSRRPDAPLPGRYLRFGRLTTEEGLSNNQALGVAQDKDGFIWIGTAGGLNRYDGAGIKVYRNDP